MQLKIQIFTPQTCRKKDTSVTVLNMPCQPHLPTFTKMQMVPCSLIQISSEKARRELIRTVLFQIVEYGNRIFVLCFVPGYNQNSFIEIAFEIRSVAESVCELKKCIEDFTARKVDSGRPNITSFRIMINHNHSTIYHYSRHFLETVGNLS